MGYKMFSKAIAEFLGTFMLVGAFTNVSINNNAIGALGVASALMIGIYSLGSVSGANFNPAVSISLAFMSCLGWGDFSIGQLAVYIVSQLLGGLCGAWANTMIWIPHGNAPLSSTNAASPTVAPITLNLTNLTTNLTYLVNVTNTTTTLAPLPAGDMTHPWKNDVIRDAYVSHGPISVLGSEMLYTFVLVFVILNVATTKDTAPAKNNYFGLAIGFVIVAAACAVGGISMCCLNPAISFGATVMNLIWGKMNKPFRAFGYFLLYSLFEVLGGLIACCFFYECRRNEIQDAKEEDDPRKPAFKTETSMDSKLCAEFLGTFVLCITVLLVINAAPSPIGAVGIAASLMVMIYALGAVSGANFNPAVTIGLVVAGELPVQDCCCYIWTQVLAGFAACGMASLLLWGDLKTALIVKGGTGVMSGAAGGDLVAIIGAEFMFTALLVFVVLNVATGKDAGNQYYGLAIGFVIVVGAASVGSISGGCFNPAVALAVDASAAAKGGAGARYGWGFLYALLELAAGVVGAGIFKATRCSDGDDDDEAETYTGVDGE